MTVRTVCGYHSIMIGLGSFKVIYLRKFAKLRAPLIILFVTLPLKFPLLGLCGIVKAHSIFI